ncbi:MAG: NAD kinase [Bacteroidota bacterium]
MRIALHGRYVTEATLPLIKDLLQLLVQRQAHIVVSQTFDGLLRGTGASFPPVQSFAPGDDLGAMHLMISLGGDGTLLEAVNYVGAAATPILGMNMGRMGFLATIPCEEAVAALTGFWEGRYKIDQRTLLQLTMQGEGGTQVDFALNEVALLKRDSSSMITVQACIDDSLCTTYWADGLMVATPTGSTGYSLSCGGPIVLPSAHNLVLTPISPHNLSVRPLVLPDSATLSFRIASRNNTFLVAVDGRSKATHIETTLTVQKASFQAHLVKMDTNNIFDVLRQKLHWGLDIRN